MSRQPIETNTNQINLGNLPEHLQWKGEGLPPAKWEAQDEHGNAVIVYRSYEDYCDD